MELLDVINHAKHDIDHVFYVFLRDFVHLGPLEVGWCWLQDHLDGKGSRVTYRPEQACLHNPKLGFPLGKKHEASFNIQQRHENTEKHGFLRFLCRILFIWFLGGWVMLGHWWAYLEESGQVRGWSDDDNTWGKNEDAIVWAIYQFNDHHEGVGRQILRSQQNIVHYIYS